MLVTSPQHGNQTIAGNMSELIPPTKVSSSSNTPSESPKKIVAVIPAYNEERFIASVVLKTMPLVDAVIVVDDGSKDDTVWLAKSVGATVICHEQNSGKGVALNTGFRQARKMGADIVVTIDADGQHLPEELAKVVAPIKSGEADIVIGSRYLEKTSDVPTHRILGHAVFNWITHAASGTASTDSQSGYRAFSQKAVQAISFKSSSFSVESEMQFLARQHDLKVNEVPITIRYQDAPKRSVIGQGLTVLNGILRLVGQYRPFMFFGAPGIILSIMGILMGGWVVNIYRQTQELAVGYGLICVLLFIVGNLLLTTGVILHSVRAMLLELQELR
ncbi:MAG TPA: glycosyltransferase family 2 protein [Anaerolineae bacterium]|nr:glycosyltransferase family 2 protein [Anaerolineae bacterium]